MNVGEHDANRKNGCASGEIRGRVRGYICCYHRVTKKISQVGGRSGFVFPFYSKPDAMFLIALILPVCYNRASEDDRG